MELEDYLEPEIAVTAAVTAAAFSRRGRKILHQGAVYGVAGALIAGDILSSFVRNVGQGFKEVEERGMHTSAESPTQVQTLKSQGV